MRKKHYLIAMLFLSIAIVIFIFPSKNNSRKSITYENKTLNIISDDLTSAEKVKAYQKVYNNDDIIGRIKIVGTSIDNYLLQTKDNSYYLNHLLDKSYNKEGEIFLDYRNQIDDKKLLIYGHNFRSQSGKFHDLVNYVSKDYYFEHPYIELETLKEDSRWQIFSVMIVTGKNYPHTILRFDDVKWIEHINWMKEESIYDTEVLVDKDDYILTLQTCYYDGDSSSKKFLVINAKKI